jgi:hypothetical protein
LNPYEYELRGFRAFGRQLSAGLFDGYPSDSKVESVDQYDSKILVRPTGCRGSLLVRASGGCDGMAGHRIPLVSAIEKGRVDGGLFCFYPYL